MSEKEIESDRFTKFVHMSDEDIIVATFEEYKGKKLKDLIIEKEPSCSTFISIDGSKYMEIDADYRVKDHVDVKKILGGLFTKYSLPNRINVLCVSRTSIKAIVPFSISVGTVGPSIIDGKSSVCYDIIADSTRLDNLIKFIMDYGNTSEISRYHTKIDLNQKYLDELVIDEYKTFLYSCASIETDGSISDYFGSISRMNEFVMHRIEEKGTLDALGIRIVSIITIKSPNDKY